jgi:small subunit ribosomal protein S11
MVDENKVEETEVKKSAQQPAAAEAKPAKPAAETEDKAAPDAVKDLFGEGEEEAPIRSTSKSRHGAISGIVHVMATFNNTKVTITDRKGNVIAWRSGGRCGFKGSRKSTAYAATVVAQEAAREAASKGLREAEVRLNGPGAGRESAVRAIHAARIKVTSIQDVTPIPHNGCRPPKRRRV